MFPSEPQPFLSHPLLANGHVQTLAGMYLPGKKYRYAAVQHRIQLPDGDVVVLHDDRPESWQPGGEMALLIHGLAGCHLSPYMVRIAGKLNEVGIRTFRFDLRGCGAGAGLAKLPYHGGKSDDVRSVLKFLEELCPESSCSAIGFSLSGNMVLKLVGEEAEPLPENLAKVIAVNPPVQLAAAAENISRPSMRVYDRHFVNLLYQQVLHRKKVFPDAPLGAMTAKPRSLVEFDDCYTAPVSGFRDAADYYKQCSAAQFLSGIQIPTTILAAADDPMVPRHCFTDLQISGSVKLHLVPRGGHLGYIARKQTAADRRWLDWRIVEWVTEN